MTDTLRDASSDNTSEKNLLFTTDRAETVVSPLLEQSTKTATTDETARPQPPKRRKQSCAADGCRRRLKLLDMQIKCKCGECHCRIHRDPKSHECPYNFKEALDHRKAGLGGGTPSKFERC